MPELPSELERDIFELAFRTNRRELRRGVALKQTLCLVARRVQIWIDLVYYELVSITNQRGAERFLSLIQSNLKPPGFFAAVKTLCLPSDVTAKIACGILSTCPQIESLACWVDYKNNTELPLLLCPLPLRRLSIEAKHFSTIPLIPSTWLSGVTHLDLFTWRSFPASDLSKLESLPRLTHVALTITKMGSEHVAVVRASCPRLQVLVLLKERNAPTPDFENDHRIVVQDEPKDPDADWEAPYFGQPDMWSCAEAVVEQQMALSIGTESKLVFVAASTRTTSCS
ncbi:hypothetical protein B0H19DRAFT_1240149 [Mycena capillaripes]|nr:hypothetical protein B0H19DRAFT_1240149 [Mycena capillaripes]